MVSSPAITAPTLTALSLLLLLPCSFVQLNEIVRTPLGVKVTVIGVKSVASEESRWA